MRNSRFKLLAVILVFLFLVLSGACSIIKPKETRTVPKPEVRASQREVIEPEEQPLVEADLWLPVSMLRLSTSIKPSLT